MNIVLLGTYDMGKPRVRLLRDAAFKVSDQCCEVHKDVWAGVEDKSQLRGVFNKLARISRLLLAYPVLIWRYLGTGRHEAVIIPYLGLFDVILFWPFIKLKGAKIYWDVFFSLYDTIVFDRQLAAQSSLKAKIIYGLERLASRLADVPFLDTRAHSQYFAQLYGLPEDKVAYLPVGVEEKNFQRLSSTTQDLQRTTIPIKVLFYGQFIPLHGLDTLVDAMEIWDESGSYEIHWTLIGTGQESQRIDSRINNLSQKMTGLNVRRIEWTPYEELAKEITAADICCGIFGTSEKALRVIPNKVHQIIACGKPLITGDSPAMREFVRPCPAVELVQPGNSRAIAEGLENLGRRLLESPENMSESLQGLPICGIDCVGAGLSDLLSSH